MTARQALTVARYMLVRNMTAETTEAFDALLEAEPEEAEAEARPRARRAADLRAAGGEVVVG